MGTNTSTCTMGFTARERGTNTPYVVTAAHCGEGGTFYHGPYLIGRSNRSNSNIFGARNGYDSLRVPDDGPQVGIRPWIFESIARPEYPVNAVGAPHLHRAGVSRCFSGRSTHGLVAGPTCGTSGHGPTTVTAPYTSGGLNYTTRNAYYFDTVCAKGGDSGAPVYRNGTLDGMVFGGRTSRFGCVGSSGTYYNLALHIADALNLNVFQTG